MVWKRYARITARWKCRTARGYLTKIHEVEVTITDEYDEKPLEDIDTWINRVGKITVDEMCSEACGSLSVSVWCEKSSVEFDVIYTSETLVVEKKIEKKIEKEIEVKIPFDVPLRIERIEEMIKEAETAEEKEALEFELTNLKKRFGIK